MELPPGNSHSLVLATTGLGTKPLRPDMSERAHQAAALWHLPAGSAGEVEANTKKMGRAAAMLASVMIVFEVL
jgi:hypothetical protein